MRENRIQTAMSQLQFMAYIYTQCDFDSECQEAGQACAGPGGFCYEAPKILHEFCFKSIDCYNIDRWATCKSNTCQCEDPDMEFAGGCWLPPNPLMSSNSMSSAGIITYTVLAIIILVSVILAIIGSLKKRTDPYPERYFGRSTTTIPTVSALFAPASVPSPLDLPEFRNMPPPPPPYSEIDPYRERQLNISQ